MDSPRWLLLAAGCWLLLLPPGDWGLETRALRSFYLQELPPSSEKELLGALQEALEKLQKKRIPPWGKKLGQVPVCDLGELCAVRKASRTGKLCNCPRGSTCNFFLLKCL
ncbi:cocaine- and amphetamine-regulated transcript protein-like [Mauremys reevesii]|uniref:cocaine- and amphetamine-regulated transcript protein-like n=1 Tax=Mauremys reevesii TaxID=260615 RepID=UPI001940001D|nr:cocaine- and amphetamine-regulated transcript protein-like [Mauremys reevesii]